MTTRFVTPPGHAGLMRHDEIADMARNNPAWRLLCAGNAPLILSFLGQVFVDENVREIGEAALVGKLDDELFAHNQRLGAGTYPKTPKDYLADWSSADRGWLRKYYVPGSDEPHYDASVAVERAVGWVNGLRAREFVGTESRLNIVFDLLRQIVRESDTDPEARLVELRRQRLELDQKIAATERGDFEVLDDVGRRDRYQQFAETARALLADFRQVEANLRDLDRELREKIATWRGTKGQLLDEFVDTRLGIGDSDQGRSLKAFHDLLLTSDRLRELTDLIASAGELNRDNADERLALIHFEWLNATERAQSISGSLSEQLRRFLDDQVWIENRRITELMRNIEATAVATRDEDAEFTFPIDGVAPAISLPLERPLYRPPVVPEVDSTDVQAGQATEAGSALFEQYQVDKAPLIEGVRAAIRRNGQATLAQVVAQQPLTRGLEELLTYFNLGAEVAFDTHFDDSTSDTIEWTGADGAQRTATLPRVIFSRGGAAPPDHGGRQ